MASSYPPYIGGGIAPGSLTRNLLNTTTAGSAVISKVIAGTGITLTQTGVDAGTGDVTITSTGTGVASTTSGSTSQINIQNASNKYSAALFGYVGDGASHTVSAKLGISTLAGLVAYTLPDATTPYSFVNTFPFGNLYNQMTSAATAAANTLTFQFATTVAQSAALVNPAIGDFRLWVASTTGIDKGDNVTGTNIPAGAQVVRVNPYNGFVYLSKALTAAPTVGGAVTFAKPCISSLTTGMTIKSPSAIAGRTITAINTGTGVVTFSGATASVAAGAFVTFWSVYTDAQAAALQMDGLAIQAAIQKAKTAGNGEVFFTGQGKLSHPLVIPESATAFVNLIGGEGKTVTTLTMDRDLGVYIPAISCGDPTASKDNLVGRMTASYYEGDFANFTINGPTAVFQGSTTQGQTPCWMDGIAWGARRTCTGIKCQFFYNGWELRGDHTLFTSCEAPYCYNAWRWGDSCPVLYGDLIFIKCFFTGAFFAGVSVSKNAIMSGEFNAPYFGQVPIQIYGEPGTGDSYGQPYAGGYAPLIQDAVLIRAQHEWAANGSIIDGNNGDNIYAAASPKVKQREIARTTWENPYFSFNLTYQIPGYGLPYYIDVSALDGVKMLYLGANSFPTTSGFKAVCSIDGAAWYGGDSLFEGDMTPILATLYSGSAEFICSTSSNTVGGALGFKYVQGAQNSIKFKGKMWEGFAELVSTAVIVPVGTVIEFGGPSLDCRVAQGGTTNPVVGVVMGGCPVAPGSADDRFVIVANKGRIPVAWVTGTTGNIVNQWVKVSTGTFGQAIPATGPADGQSIGWTYSTAGGNATPYVDVRPQH